MKNSKFGQFFMKYGAVIFSISGILVITIAVMLVVNGSIKESEPGQEYHIDLNEMAEGDGTENSSLVAQGEGDGSGASQSAQGAEEEVGVQNAQGAEAGAPQIAQDRKENEGTQVADSAQNGEQTAENIVVADGNVGNAEVSVSPELTAESQQTSDTPSVDVADMSGNGEEYADEAQTASSAGSSVEQKDAVDLFFEEGMGILWPVEGNVVLNYNDSHLIYRPTLDQFRTHDAIAIAAEAGTAVVAAADGIVTAIENNVQTGITVTTSIGNDYYLVYGQLEDSGLKIGDSVKQGAVIGTIATVSRFYSKEGDNLYFQVRCGEETLNPMSLLGRVNEESDAVETTLQEE